MTGSKARPEPFLIDGETVLPGTSARMDLFVALLPTHTPIHLPLTVVHGRRPGPCIWLSAALHGDELNGIEIIRQVLARIDPQKLAGTILAVPVVNVFGFLQQSRYLPDRRDLNRSFPGSSRGSLAARLADLFLREIVDRCSHGIDLHTASNERTNVPQIRANLDDQETKDIAQAFAAPILIHVNERDGSLRQAAAARGIPVLLYEAGEASRFNRDAVGVGTDGVLRVIHQLGMLKGRGPSRRKAVPVLVSKRAWVRARRGGLLRLLVKGGQWVKHNQLLGRISDPFGEDEVVLRAPFDGLIIGHSLNPVAMQGDAVVHVGRADPQADSPSP